MNKAVNKFTTPLSPEALYWCGFIAADGCLHDTIKYSYNIEITLKGEDKDHLIKLAKFLEIDPNRVRIYFNRQYERKISTARIIFSSKEIFTKLNELGITPRKSLTLEVSNELSSLSDFWRGLFDGDGCIRFNPQQNPCMELTGSHKIIEQFRKYLESNNIKATTKYRSGGKVSRLRLTGHKSQELIKLIYSNSNIFLDRKKILAEKALLWKSKYQLAN